MGGVISFGGIESDGLDWFCAGWCFESFLDAVIARNGSDRELVQAVLVGKYNQGLILAVQEERNAALARRLRAAIQATARELVEDDDLTLRVNKRTLDPEEVRMFQDGMQELLEVMQREK